jgi:hypothetical protein
MSNDISLEWGSGATAVPRPAGEVYASVGLPSPDASPGADVGDAGEVVGTVIARRDGRPIGWVTVYRNADADAGVWAQGEQTGRLARRLVLGFRDDVPATVEEHAAFVLMYREAAERARAAGGRVLRWSGADTGPEGEAARALGARTAGEIARIWTADPAAWLPPAGLPAVSARTLPSPAVGLAGGGAEVGVTVDGDRAYLDAGEAIRADGVEADVLAALLAELLDRLHHDHPAVRELAVFEFDADATGTVRHALPLAGLRIADRILDYELPLNRESAADQI